ncbi:hypothetical protein J3E64_000705 [Sphingobium sp. OAS761]|uniref:HvfC/BufC N-terminal domain-containing protein n=1 Tax=Sphingobium sp. OAS761 TaxID=2817901 RepID=UPI00209F60EC|nr:DNA-binding domain-containing protein [Sphingobium sp. OAS761]MCP1469034.1 hypothetical protein [Sphingobium sp. OAS761]
MRLKRMQRDFLSWLAGEESESAAMLPLADRRGLAVYRNNYRGALMACLAESFPITRAWLGETAFDAAAARHVDRVPPSSWTLDAYARDFPAGLADDYPRDMEVAELARLELTLSDVFTAADSSPVTVGDLSMIDWDGARLSLVPAASILSLRSNAPDIWSALADDEADPPAGSWGAEPRQLLVWRQEWLCHFRPVDDDEASALAMMGAGGLDFAMLCERLVRRLGEAAGVAQAGEWLGRWAQEGLLCHSLPSGPGGCPAHTPDEG